MVGNGQFVTPSSVDDLLARLDEPRVVAALNDLLDHAELLALVVTGLGGLVSRGEVIGDSLSEAVSELRGARGNVQPLSSFDLQGLANSLATLSGSVVRATPALTSLLSSQLIDPKAVDVIAQLGSALVQARERIDEDASFPTGVIGLLRTLKDEDVSRGLGYLIQVARSFGRQLSAR